jgi:hypothetical protein
MISRDIRYTIIKPMLNEGKIQKFSDIFKFIPMSVVAGDLGKRSTRFKELVEKVEEFDVNELLIIARMFDLTVAEIFKLVEKELSNRHIKI